MSQNRDIIPITFEYEGKSYKGEFSPVFGAGAQNWHLMIDNYYQGQLTVQEGKFVFLGRKFQEMGEKFGDVVIAFHQ